MKYVRAGFIGCGRHATKNLYPCLKYAPMQLIATCDLDEGKAARNASWFGAERYYSDHLQMMQKENLDAVFIATEVKSHPQLVESALHHNLHVFVEKPPATSYEEISRLCSLSKKKHKYIMVGFMKRFALAYQKARVIISSSAFGKLSMIESKFCIGRRGTSAYAFLLQVGIHHFDLIRYFMGEIEEVHSEKKEMDEMDETKISYAISLRFKNGAVGIMNLSNQQSWVHHNERVEITGEGEFLIVDNIVRLQYYKKNDDILVWEPGFSIPSTENQSYFFMGFAGEIQHFARSILEGKHPTPDIWDAYKAMEVIREIEPNQKYETKKQVSKHFKHWIGDEWLEQRLKI